MKLFLLIALAAPNMLLIGNEVQANVVNSQAGFIIASPNPLGARISQTLPINLSQAVPPPAKEIKVLVAEVVIKMPSGQPSLPPEIEKKVYDVISTKPGLVTTRTQLQTDINAVFAMGFFSNVQAEPEDTDTKNGIRVNFFLTPNPVLKAVNTQGTKVLDLSTLTRIFGSQIGKITNLKDIQAGVKALEKFYQDNGYVLAQVVDIKATPEGTVTLTISEGEVEDIKVAYLNEDGKTQDKDGKSVVGNTPESVILREISLKKGDIFNKSTIESDLQKVFGLGIFDDLNIGLAPGRDPRKVVVTINVMERNVSEAERLLKQGNEQSNAGNFDSALRLYQQSLDMCRQIGDRQCEVDALNNLGAAYFNLNDYPKALSFSEQTLKIAREIKDRENEGGALNNLGAVYLSLKDHPKALSFIEQALSIAREIKNRKDERLALKNLRVLYEKLDNYNKIIENEEQALTIARELKDRKAEEESLRYLGIAYINIEQKDLAKAIAYFEQALMIARELKDRDSEANNLRLLGTAYIYIEQEDQQNYPKAIAYFDQALTIVRNLKDRVSEAEILRRLGIAYIKQTDYPKAIASYERALALARELKDKDVEWRALSSLGEVYKSQTDYLKAIAYYEQALKIVRELKDRNGEAHVLLVLSGAYLPLADYPSAIAYSEKALAIAQEIKDPKLAREKARFALFTLVVGYSSLGDRPKMLAYSDKLWESYQKDSDLSKKDAQSILSSLTKKDIQEGILPFLSLFLSFKGIEPNLSTDGYDYFQIRASISSKGFFKFDMGDKVLDPKAIAYFEQSLAAARVNKDRNRETIALVALSLGYILQEDYLKASTTLEQSLKIVRELKNPLYDAVALAALGYAYNSQGDFPKAISLGEQSLKIVRELKNPTYEAAALAALGYAYNSQGDFPKAIALGEQSLKIVRELKVPLYEAAALGALGYVYNSQGDYPKAIALGEQSLKIVRELKNPTYEVLALNFLGAAYSSKGDYPKAIALGEQSLKIVRELKNPTYETLALGFLGGTYSGKGDYPKAISYYEQVLAISQKLKDLEGEASALTGIAMAYAKLGDPKEIGYLEQALAIYRKQPPKDGEKNIRELGEAYADLGKYPQALLLFQESVNILRGTGDRSAVSKAFIDLGDLLIKQKHPELAIPYYKQAINAIESIRGDIRQLGKRQQRSYVGKIERTYRNLADLLLQQGRVTEALQVLDLLKVQELEDYFKTFSRTDATAKGIAFLPAEQSAISNRLSQDQLANRNQQLATALKQEIATERDRFPDALKQIPKGSALLYPVLLDDRLELVLFIPGQQPIHRSVAVKPDQIKEVINEFRLDIQDSTSLDVMVSSQKLYNWLLRPLAADLEKSNITTILYAPDKQLRYVPIAALHDGKQWVVERYQIGYLIAYNLVDFKGNVPKTLRVLAGALGKNGYPGLPPLPATLTEVESIATSVPETLNLLQDNFTRQNIQQNLQGHTVLHLATHAEFRGGSPADSFILMGNGDKLTLADLIDWRLPGVDLVVLSACQTGLGKTDQGIEFLGFGYQMQLAGSKGTLSSLWSVSDGGTGVLMDGFYRQFSKTPNSLAALRNAQITMIRQADSLTGESKRSYDSLRSGLPPKVQGNLTHPYYWSAFISIQNSFVNTQAGDGKR